MTPKDFHRKKLSMSLADVFEASRFKVIWHNDIEEKFEDPQRSSQPESLTSEEMNMFNVSLIHFIQKSLNAMKETA